MKRIVLIVFFLFFIIPNVFAACEENQIDINTASKEALMEIIYIGEIRAEQLIVLRPFENLDDLVRIKGIGEVY